MPTFKQRFGAALKAFWGSGDWVNSDRPGNRYSSWRYEFEPQTRLNYAALVGDLWTNSAVQACLNWIIRAWPESYPCVKEVQGKKKVPVDDHPLVKLLEIPSEEAYDDTVLWAGTILSFWVDGNAYWGINRTRGSQAIGEFVYIPHDMIRPMRDEGSRNPGPDYFEMKAKGSGDPIRVKVEDIVHFRFGIDPHNDLLGMSAWKSVNRHVYTDNEAVNYVATTLRKRGAAWLIASPKESGVSFEDPEKVKKDIAESTSGDERGGVLVLDGAVDFTLPPPMKDQSMDTAHRIPETRTCALAGIPAMAAGLASGLERSTFSNTDQAEAAAWNTIVAVQRMMGRQLTRQVLRRKGNFPDWEEKNGSKQYWAGFDYSEVRALQPDKQQEWERIGKAYFVYNLLTEDEARAELGYEPITPKQRAAMTPKPAQVPVGAASSNGNGTSGAKSYPLPIDSAAYNGETSWADRVVAEIEALQNSGEIGNA